MQSEVQKYIQSSDYANLKNTSSGVISLSIPSGISIGSGAVYTANSDITLGSRESTERVVLVLNGTNYLCQTLVTPARPDMGMNATITVFRLTDTQMRMTINIYNPYASTVVTNTAISVNALIQTFIPPYII